MNHVAIIKALGGAAELASALRARGVVVANVTARSWMLNGRTIPAKYWVHVLAVAQERGVKASLDLLAQDVAVRLGIEPPYPPSPIAVPSRSGTTHGGTVTTDGEGGAA